MEGPLHPAALAVMVVVPLQPPAYVTAPVPATIALPPVILAASREYVMPVELVAVVVVVTTPAPWQRVEVAGVNGDMLTVGVIVTTTLFVLVHPVAVMVSTRVYVVLTSGLTDGFDSVEVNPAGTEVQL